VELAIGVDQGGSARIPASFCGASSLKATHGLIPSHGIAHIDHTIDYACAIARSLELVARATDVMSGHDWRDPQWARGALEPTSCVEQLGRGVEGMRIAILTESTDEVACEPGVLEGLERARKALEDAGATITTVSVPLWSDAWAIEVALLCILGWAMAQSEGVGFGNLGLVDTARAHSYALTRRLEADEFPPFLKAWLLAGRYMHDNYYGTYLGKAQNLRLELRRQVDEALAGCDLLLTPTTPHSAPLLAVGQIGDFELLKKATTMTANVAPLNLTGHPALAVPAGLDGDSLPVSAQLIGRHLDDATTFRAGAVLEEALGVPAAKALQGS
jgi:amidase